MPVGLGVCAVAPAFVHAFYPPVWWPMIPVMQALSIFAMLTALPWSAGDVYKAIGRPDLCWKVSAMQAPALIVALIVGARLDGIVGVALAQVAVAIPLAVFNFWLIDRVLNVGRLTMLKDLAGPAAAGALMWAAAAAVSWITAERARPLFTLLGQVFVGAIVYGALLVALDNRSRALLRTWRQPLVATEAIGPGSLEAISTTSEAVAAKR
jgi:O-antigen/teichoic acid export membrane protein